MSYLCFITSSLYFKELFSTNKWKWNHTRKSIFSSSYAYQVHVDLSSSNVPSHFVKNVIISLIWDNLAPHKMLIISLQFL